MRGHIFEPGAYEAGSLAGCYWAQTAPDCPDDGPVSGAAKVEFAVIGAGFTGLSAALRLAQGGADVAVLDMHRPGWGASGRNGGFCCVGGASATSGQIRARYGATEAERFHATERAAINHVSTQIERLGLEVDRHSRGELQLAHSPKAFAEMTRDAPDLAKRHGVEASLIAPAELAERGLGAAGMHGALHLDLGFALNPRKLALGLAGAVRAAGGRIHGDSAVLEITQADGYHVLRTTQGEIRAKHLVIATNGYSSDNVPGWLRWRYLPLQSSVLVTRPLSDAEIAAQGWSSDLMAYDSRHLLHYFRLMPDRRMLFGMRGATRWTPNALETHRRETRAHFDAMFPAWRDVEAPHFWSGLLCFSREMVPFVGEMGAGSGVHGAFAYHGNGVAMANWCGDQLARRLLGQASDLPQFFSRTPKRFEMGPWRRAALPLALVRYRVLDRL
ncbi:gamma-glutamylputrescine oxidoreductase [Thioclava dalianensis]|uniref:Gamma-glutamylputrescine oxidoreductase n=1 Tax=Thioclava dalianensis TaxID=1185766 RepID=A0A074U9P8_9RHOB|nr:gamma-glutamylputrescine oxidoreductase [Thioclava dalianensis]